MEKVTGIMRQEEKSNRDQMETTQTVVAMEKVTGIMRQEEKSNRDQLEIVVCMSLEEMEWSISIAEEEEVQECGDVILLIVMVHSRASTYTLALLRQVYGCVCGVPYRVLLEMCTGRLSSAVIIFTLESEANEDPPEFTLTCQSRRGPVTEVEWRRDRVRVEKDSNHMTSQIIVDTSRNTVYNNTLRVRGRESGTYVCTVRNNAQDFFPDSDIQWDQTSGTLVLRGKSPTSTTFFTCNI